MPSLSAKLVHAKRNVQLREADTYIDRSGRVVKGMLRR